MTPLPSHPFITFDFDSSRCVDARTWIALGEAMSKCQHVAGTPLKPAMAERFGSIYLARGVLATTAIEGNTLSQDEVDAIVKNGTAGVPESRAYLEREVKNVLDLIREIDHALEAHVRLPLDVERLCHLNSRLLEGIPDSPEVQPGQLREHDVAVGPYKPPHYTDVPSLANQLVAWLGEQRTTPAINPEDRFVQSVLAAVLAHLYIAWIHPFGNGNGRLARLVEVQILSESGVVPIVATNLLSDYYNKTRTRYYLALDEARRDPGAFVRYAIRGFLDELRDQVEVLREQSLNVHWESYVYEVFQGQPRTDARDRQRAVALMFPSDQSLSPEQISLLTPQLARRYALGGPRTPARDLNQLCQMGLVEKVASRRLYRVRRDVIKAFLPPIAATIADASSN